MAENVDSSYYVGGDTLGGAYLGQDYNALPFYAITERFGKPVETGSAAQQEGVRLGSGEELIRILNKDTGQIVYEGYDPNELRAALDTLTAGGNQTQWELQQYSPGSIDPITGEQNAPTQWRTTDSNLKEQSALGMLADYALPVIMSAIIPGSGLLHGALTAAGGSALSGIAQGKPLGDIAKSALISGVGGGIGGALGGAGSATGGGSLGLSPAFEAARGAGGSLISGLGGGIGAGLGGLADEAIMTVLGNTLGSGAGAGLGSAVGGALGSIAGGGGGYQAQPGDSPMINVSAPTVSTGSLGGMAGLSGIGAQAVRDILAQQALAAQQTQGDEITVTAPAIGGGALLPALGLGGLGLAGLGAAAGGGGSAAAPIAETIDPEMVVTASPQGGLVIPPAVPSAGLNPGSLLPAAVPLVVPPVTLPPTTPPRTIGDYINAVRGGIGVIGGIGSLLGGGGDQGAGLPAGFNPNSGTVTYTPLNRTQNAAPFDPFTYGQTSGERSFFNPYELQYQTNVPSAQTTPAPAMKDGGEAEFDDSIEGHLAAYYSNGGHAGPGPVKGIGSGQEDKIPAWLSDGEYVWSAQDVADLGDGSSNEGVRRLDKMRQMVRKGAGRKDTKSIARPQKGIDTMLKAVGGAA